MYINPLFRKVKRHKQFFNPKDFWSKNPLFIHINTHTYCGKPFFQNQKIAMVTKNQMLTTAKKWQIEILEIGLDYTHCHILVKKQPNQNLKKIVNLLKGASSKKVRNKFPWLKKFQHFWADSFYITFWQEKNLDKIRKYIQNQPRERHSKAN